MKKTTLFTVFVFAAIFCLGFNSCKNLGIDPTLTFNIERNFTFPVPPETPVGILFETPGIPIGLSSDELKAHGTDLQYLKSVKLTKLDMVSGDVTYPLSSFDTMIVSVKTDTSGPLQLANYSGSINTMSLSNADFLPFIKSESNAFIIAFKANKAPATTVTFTANYTLTFTADPLP